MRIIAVVNQKGGVGKTTTSVNLGAALALRGRRVLLVDLDPQGNLTDHLLGDAPDQVGAGDPANMGGAGGEAAARDRTVGTPRASVYDVLVEGKPILDAVVPTSTPGLHVLPSHEDLAGAELDLASIIGREVLLRDALADVPAQAFDYVLLDCPPSLGLLSLNALAAAHEVFIALQTEFFAMRGLGALDRTVDLVKRRINPSLRVTGIVPTLVDATRLSREVVDEVRGHYGELVFASRIRSNIRLAEAPSHGKHIFDYAPDSPGAADYSALAKEVEEGRGAVVAAEEAAAASQRSEGGTGPTGAVAAASVSASPGSPEGRPTRLRGIARAIQEATAEVVAGAGLGRTPPKPSASPPASTAGEKREPVATPTVDSRPAGSLPAPLTDSPAGPVERSPASPGELPRSPPAPPPLPEHDRVPSFSSAPDAPSVARPAAPVTPIAPVAPPRRPALPLPVLRSGSRPLGLTPMPTRPPSALPRPTSPPRPSRSD